MSQYSSKLVVLVDHTLKNDAGAALCYVGLTLSEAVRIFLREVVKEGGLPPGVGTKREHYEAALCAELSRKAGLRKPSKQVKP